MATAFVSVASEAAALAETTEVAIIGGGICGILAAKGCRDRNLPYRLIERGDNLGGNWMTLANGHSYLQAPEPNYRWDDAYKLNSSPFTKNSGIAVLHKLRDYAYDHGVYTHAWLGTEVLTIKQLPDDKGKYRLICQDTKTGAEKHLLASYLSINCGILSTQWTGEERGVKGLADFKGAVTLAGKHAGQDSAVGNTDLTGKNVVIMGSGSFAAEAMEAAGRNGAAHITIISRKRSRMMMPFSRSFTITALNFMPFFTWAFKQKMVLGYLRKFFYRPCGMAEMLPHVQPHELDFSGQCSDGFFRLAFEKRLSCVIEDPIDRMEGKAAVLASGKRLPCDMLVVASGCKYNLQPPFLRELGVGFNDLHNFAFMGPSPRIGTASDFVFAHVPVGPQQQINMFLHAVLCCKAGLEAEATAALRPTALANHGNGVEDAALVGGRMAGKYTWFESRPWAKLNFAMEDRVASMMRTHSVGRSFLGRIGLRLQMLAMGQAMFFYSMWMACNEIARFPVFGKGVPDHYARPDLRSAVGSGVLPLPAVPSEPQKPAPAPAPAPVVEAEVASPSKGKGKAAKSKPAKH